MKIAIINSLDEKKYLQCLSTLKKSIKINEHEVQRFPEKRTRGHTLNFIIKKFGTNSDILIVADDIKFTSGWFQKLEKHKNKAEIWGASMLYPKTRIIQDNGYELVKYKQSTILRPLRRGDKLKNDFKKDWKYVDCVCGCFLFFNKEAFKFQKKFYPSYGMNRWDEFTFIQKAKSKGLRLAVLNHFFYHDGISTKNNKKKILSSTSYQIEKKLWQRLENKFINKKKIEKKINIKFDKNVIKILNDDNKKILLYGAGIFTENLLSINHMKNNNISITSSFSEEIGKKLGNKYSILNFNKLNFRKYNTVIITPFDYAEKIFIEKFIDWKEKNWKGKIYKVLEKKTSYSWNYCLKKI